ncbi:MAG: hypothetical protein ACRELA_03810 [Candidatus Rokuibacteriota bacterium]
MPNGASAAGGAVTRLILACVIAAAAGEAWAHWTIASTLTSEEPGRAFTLRLHYELLAGQSNPDEPLRVCFWLERYRDGRYAPVTVQACEKLTLKASEWRTLSYSAEGLRWLSDGARGSRLTRGQYRAIAVIESDASFVSKLIWGAAKDRKALPFQIE